MFYLQNFLVWWQQALLPHKCLVCREEGVILCDTHKNFTAAKLPLLTKFLLLDGLQATTDYAQPNAAQLVKFLKFYGHRYTAKLMAEQIIASVPSHILKNAVIAPIPLHWWRRWQRGFNQSALIAQAMVELQPSLKITAGLTRNRLTRQQARLSRAERIKNMQQAFIWKASEQPPVRVILLDDVCTTGSTLQAASKTLKKAGAQQVIGVVFAYQRLSWGYLEKLGFSAIIR